MDEDLERLRRALAERYRVEREIGRGGMATVYLALDLKHQRQVAVKVLNEELATAVGAERFLREIQVAARLNHPHIVPLHDSGSADGLLYYVMPYLDGESLRDRIRRERQLAFSDVLSITRDVAQALAYAHAQGVLHRDIKPENVLLSGGSAVVLDFGIARAITRAGQDRLTSTGLVLGTPEYMSPEQAFGDAHITERSDVYSLGCVVYEMLAGGPPFTGGSQPAIVARHAADPMPSLRTVRGTVPAQVERVIETALAKAPNDRFATTTEFLQRLSDGLQTPPHPTAPAARPRRWQRTALVGGAAVLLTVAAAVLLRNGAPDDALPGRAPMLAVLPLENLGQPDDQYFAEGMTDEITTRLGQISGLSVISRTSALQYDLRTTPVAEVAQQLGVEWLLTGTIRTDRRSDGTGIVRVVPRLIRAADVRVTVWDGTFDAEVAPGAIFQAQAQIAEGVASELGIALQQQERAALQEQPTRDSAAYDAYLRGNNFAARPFAEAPTRRAIELFEEAARRDPNFLHAHAKLAEVESQYYYFFDRREARLQRVRAAVDRALELDSTHVAARLAYGYYLYWALSDFDRAIREFERIRQKQSNNSQLLYVLGSAYRRAGRWEDALASYERALTLNPRSQLIAADLGSTHLVLRNFADASRYLDRAIELAPDWTVPYAVRGHLYLSWHGDVERVRATLLEAADKGGYPALLSTLINRFRYLLSVADGALEDSLRGVTLQTMPLDSMSYYLAKAHWHGTRGRKGPQRAYYDSALAVGEGRVRARPDDADFHVDLGLAYAGLGRRADAEREVQRALQLLPSTRDAYFGQLIMGWGMVVYSETGNADSAVSLMRQALGAPSSLTPAMLRASPRYANLRGDRRFDSLAQIR